MKIFSILHFSDIPIIIFILLLIIIYYPSLSFVTEFVDRLDQMKDNTFISIRAYSGVYFVSEEYQFDSFVWMVSDGVSWEFTEDLRNIY